MTLPSAGVPGLLTAVTAALQVLHHHQPGALLLADPGLYAAPAHHHGHLLLPGECGHAVLVPPVTGPATLHYLHVCRRHLNISECYCVHTRPSLSAIEI